MSAVWAVDPKLPVDHDEQTGPGDAGVTHDYRTVIIRRRLSGGDDLQGDPSICGAISSKPDGGETAERELVDNPVATIVHITKMYRVKALA